MFSAVTALLPSRHPRHSPRFPGQQVFPRALHSAGSLLAAGPAGEETRLRPPAQRRAAHSPRGEALEERGASQCAALSRCSCSAPRTRAGLPQQNTRPALCTPAETPVLVTFEGKADLLFKCQPEPVYPHRVPRAAALPALPGRSGLV